MAAARQFSRPFVKKEKALLKMGGGVKMRQMSKRSWSRCCKTMGWKKIVGSRKLRKSRRELRHGRRVYRAKQRRCWRLGEKKR